MAGKKLLYTINHPDWFWSHRLPLALGARDNGYDVHVAMSEASSDVKLKDAGFTGHDLPSSEKSASPVMVLKTALAIHKLLKEEQPDTVHAITLKYAFITGLAARFNPKVKAVHTIAGLGYLFSGNGLKPKILRFLIGPFLKFALKGKGYRIIFQNPDDMELMFRRRFVRKDQAHLIRGSGVDTAQFKPTGETPEDPPIVLMPTRLVRDKGIAVFVTAARLLRKKEAFRNVRFQIAGGISKNNPLAITEKEMNEIAENGTVEWLGKVDDMPALLAKSTLIAYPSYYREGVPKVLLEAAAMGKAIVTTNHTGCKEAVSHGYNGLLVPIKDAAATADAIEELLTDPERRKKMEESSRKKACEEFDVKLVVDKTLKVYSE